LGGRWAVLTICTAALAGCATPQTATPPITSTAQAVPTVIDFCRDRLRAEWSLRRRVVHLAGCEWTAWGEQRLLLEQGGWPEAQVEFGPDEDALSVWARVGEYWDVADPGHAREVRALAARAPRRELWPAWRRAWSAAFVSWVMRRSGSPDFTADPAHADYLRAALERRPESVVDVAGYAPVTGDLVCAGRGSGPRDATEFLRRLREESGFFPSHCDIIVEVGADALTLIGGNVKNAVVATVTPLADGRIPPATTRAWAVALRLAEPPDPCATMSPGPGCS
jgi:hypothetical protein